MFTGIIEETGMVLSIVRGQLSVKLSIQTKTICEGTRIGDSISVNGVCLTVITCKGGTFSANVMPETLLRSSLGRLRPGSPVNLERALTLSSRLGGHLVSGHIDGTGTIRSILKDDIANIYSIHCDKRFLRYIIEKGSIALDGVSLTVCSADQNCFSVSVIPHTFKNTTLREKKVSDIVNIECDLMAKHLKKLISPDGITESFLQNHGFTEAKNE